MSEQDQRGQNEFCGGSWYDCIVVGAGHAGCEAALVAARAGLQVLVLTGSMDAIAWMPCNPAIGGPGKAQVVREVDALGGAPVVVRASSAFEYGQGDVARLVVNVARTHLFHTDSGEAVF